MRTNLLLRGLFAGVLVLLILFSIKFWLSLLQDDNFNRRGQLSKVMDSIESTFDHLGPDPRHKLKRKLVHLDLKGMPPRISYLAKLFPLLKSLGVTGILVEYEDMFPYFGTLASVTNKKSYTKKEIAQLNLLAAENQLEIVPLIQTFGHMEFVLKLEEHIEIREVSKYSQVLCPSDNRSLELVKLMIDQVLSLHPDIHQIHIGSDEVYYLGQCSRCLSKMRRIGTEKFELFLGHVKSVAEYVINHHKKNVMMWDDEFRQLDDSAIESSGLGKLVEIVVWNYHSDVDNRLEKSLWDKYNRLFTKILIGSAFKGANQPNAMVISESQYLANHISWIRTMRSQASDVNIGGIVLTGWQRYDHFSVLCEILAIAIPCLTSCLIYLGSSKEMSMSSVFQLAAEKLECRSDFDHCYYPSSVVYDHVLRLQKYQMDLESVKQGSVYKGWAHALNLQNTFSSVSLMENLELDVSRLQLEMSSLRVLLENDLKKIYPKWAVTEWLLTHFEPTASEISTLYTSILRILDRTAFPVRPLQYNTTTEDRKE